MSKPLGNILVDSELISRKTLEKALDRQKSQGKKLGQVLEEMGVVSEQELMEALVRQQSPFAHIELKKQLGDLLVEIRLISEKTLERALERQKAEGKRLGEVLEEMGVVTEEDIVDALGKQFNFKTIKSFVNMDFAPELLNTLPNELVMKKVIFPLKQKDGMLALALADPFDGDTTEVVSRITGLNVVPVISTRREILAAISRHYLNAPIGHYASSDTILVVEDSQTVATVVQAALVREGFSVIHATDGLEALKIALTQRPRLIITDAQMPKLDGHGLLRAIKANPVTADIPVIMLTGRATSEVEQKALEAGFFDFIAKPVQPVRVVTRVKRAIELTKGKR